MQSKCKIADSLLLPHIKMAADRAGAPGLFWLTGSQQFHLMKGVSESLAGRVAVLHLLGFSRRERSSQGLFGALERLGLPVGPGGLICLAEQALPLTATAQSIPAWAI